MSLVEATGQLSSKSKNLPAPTSAKQMVSRSLEALGPSHHPVKQVLYWRMDYFISQGFSFLSCEKEIDNKGIFTEFQEDQVKQSVESLDIKMLFTCVILGRNRK